MRFVDGQPVSISGKRAIMGDDITTAVAAVVYDGPRTQAVPIMTGPRTDVRRKKKWLPWAIVGAVLALIAAGTLIFFLGTASSTTTMPHVVGETIDSAYNTIRNVGLVPGPTQIIASDKPTGTVVKTKPDAGTVVKTGSTVILYISQGPQGTPVTVPSVQGFQLADAESQLQTLGLVPKVTFTTTATGGVLPGQVISQVPAGGAKANTGDTVNLVVLSQSANFPVPDVSGQSPTTAAANLGAAGLTVASTSASKCSNTVPTGMVVYTVPAAGTQVASGTSIQLVLSSGVCNVIVPNVVGLSQSAATAALTAQGLLSIFNTDTNPGDCPTTGTGDTVFSQVPTAGAPAPYKSTVNLQYCPPLG
jgi:serine/threonine-protein kinase